MLKYKTRCIPAVPLYISKKEYNKGMSKETMDMAADPFLKAIAKEAERGWVLHSINGITENIRRKKTFLEWIFGWIPFIGRFICSKMDQVNNGVNLTIYVITFVKDE